jgi:hypothetical protein
VYWSEDCGKGKQRRISVWTDSDWRYESGTSFPTWTKIQNKIIKEIGIIFI